MNTHASTLKKYLIVFGIGTGMAISSAAQSPYLAPDDTWISISGTVDGVPTGDIFNLDYGEGMIAVEMDDWDTDADAYKLVEGDNVTVSGWIDDDLFERRTIEARSVYVENLGTYFYASGADEEKYYYSGVTVPVVINTIGLHGTVSEVSGREFTLNTGLRSITVDTVQMPYNPMDDEGFQQIEVGDVVSATGVMQTDLLDDRELHASSVVTLLDHDDES